MPNVDRPDGSSPVPTARISGPILTDVVLREECSLARSRLRLLLWLYADAANEPAARIAANATLRREAIHVAEELAAEATHYAALLRLGGWTADQATSAIEELVRDMPAIPERVHGALREHLVRTTRIAYRTPPDDEARRRNTPV